MIEIEISQTAVNEARTSAASDTNVTQRRSLDVLARDLIRIRPKLPASQRDMVSALAVKIMNYAGNPGRDAAEDNLDDRADRKSTPCSVEMEEPQCLNMPTRF
jgi:hypothetical protein